MAKLAPPSDPVQSDPRQPEQEQSKSKPLETEAANAPKHVTDCPKHVIACPRHITDCLNRLNGFEKRPHVAAAVSGGADSMALASALSSWVADRQGRLSVLIVDHRMRANSTLEARQSAARLRRKGMSCHILSVKDSPRANIQAQLRRQRFHLLSDWCQKHNVLHLFLGHHAEDQAETFLYRLARGSGVDGLAAMSVVTIRPHLRILRPFLELPGQALRDFLSQAGIGWIEDPSNSQRRFARVRWRQSARILADEGLSRERITRSCAHMARARSDLETNSARHAATIAHVHPQGYIEIQQAPLARIKGDAGGRILAAALCCVSSQSTRPRWNALCRAHHHIIQPDGFASITLHGCLILYRQHNILICREPASIGPPQKVEKGKRILWDDRFLLAPIDCREEDGNLFWRTWDHPPRRSLLCPSHPWPILQTLPVLHKGGKPIYAPHIGFCDPAWLKRVTQGNVEGSEKGNVKGNVDGSENERAKGSESVTWISSCPFFG